MPHAIAITARNVSKRYALVDRGNAWRLVFSRRDDLPTFQALRGVTFDVPKGQFVGILGRNGAGKSTLLRVLGGVYSADEGRVAVNGALSGLYELGLAGNPELTGRAYAERLLSVHGFGKRDRMEMIEDILEFSELGARFDDAVLTYSAGMAARLYFATATAGSYDVYLLDEILSVGDQHFQSKCWRRLRDRVSRGASGVLVTHDWAAIVRLCEERPCDREGPDRVHGCGGARHRHYLYGEVGKQAVTLGIARFTAPPPSVLHAMPGEDFLITCEVEIEQPAEVGIVTVIEQLQPGHGWETALMSRDVSPVGRHPGRYKVSVLTPGLPLDPGTYQISLNLVMPDPEHPQRRVLLGGFSWLDGNGLVLEVGGSDIGGLTLPARWTIEAA